MLLHKNVRFLYSLLMANFLLILVSVSVSVSALELPAIAKNVIAIDTQQAIQLQQKGALFIDVRSTAKWSIGHVSNAINLDFLTNFEKLYYANIPKDTLIVIYGESHNSVRGIYAASTASEWGYTNVHYYKDGYFRWLASNLPLELKMIKAYNALTVVKVP